MHRKKSLMLFTVPLETRGTASLLRVTEGRADYGQEAETG